MSQPSMLPDLRQAVRSLIRQPRLALLAVAILGLGMGLATGIYSLARGLILRGLPFPNAGRLVALEEYDPKEADARLPVRLSSLRIWAPGQTTLEGLATFRAAFTLFRSPGRGTDAYVGAQVAPELFPLLRVRPKLGRLLRTADCAAEEPVVLLSDTLWRTRFARSPSVLGAKVGVNRIPHTVIGVMPAGFGFPYRQDLWTSLCPRDLAGVDEGQVALYAVGRLRPGISLREAQTEFRALSERTSSVVQSNSAVTTKGVSPHAPTAPRLLARVEPYLYSVTESRLRRALAAVGGGAALLLVVCCCTVGLLLLLSTMSRQRSIAVRVALGASLGRIQQESWLAALILSLAGSLLGLALAAGFVALANRVLVPSSYLRGFWVGVRLDGPTLAFALSAAILTVPLAGLLPALRTARTDPMCVLKRSLASGALTRVGWPGRLLVGGQVVLSCIVLVGAAVTASAGLRALQVPYGFEPTGLVTAKVSLYGKEGLVDAPPEVPAALLGKVLERVRALPEVRSAALSTGLPTLVFQRRDFVLPGEDPSGARRSARVQGVTPEFVSTLGLPLLAGRNFTEADGAKAPPVVLVNRAFTKRYLGGEIGVGRELGLICAGASRPTWSRLVGVVGDSAMGDGEVSRVGTVPEALYLPLAQSMPLGSFSGSLLVRSSVPPGVLAEALRREAHAVEPDLALWDVESMTQILERESWVSRAFTGLFALYGAAAAAMACAGLYSIVSVDVRRRRRDFGIRMALGAGRNDLRRLVVRQGSPELIGGLGVGIPVALLLARRFAGTFDGGPTEPLLVWSAVALLALAGTLALLLPVRQVTRSDPMNAMRPEVE